MDQSSQSASIPSSTPDSLYTLPPFISLSSASFSWYYTTAAIVISLLVLEQSVYRYKKRHLPGAAWTIPIIGKFADSLHPTMEGYIKQWHSGDLSAISVFNIFIVMASSNDMARKVLSSPNYAEPCLINSGRTIVDPKNWVFLTGKAHADYRRGLNGLFTRRALAMYVGIQELVAKKHLGVWLSESVADNAAKPIMQGVRFLNMDTSLRVFCGQHLPEHASKEINNIYWQITRALELVNFPFAFPGTKVYKAVQARKVAMKWLELAAKLSKEAMAAGLPPTCMLDEWVTILNDPGYKARKDFSDNEMAMVLFSFLFASQDAMSSGLIYAFQHLADNPDMLAKVKEEQEKVRCGDYSKPLTYGMVEDMPYLQAFVKESLRIKPPVVMVPYVVVKPFPITPDYTAPKGTMIIPAFWNSTHDAEIYPNPDTLVPERWLDSQSLANTNTKNYIGFGYGAHKCIGVEYAMMNIVIVLATAIGMFGFDHERTPTSEEVEIIATLFPLDGCRLKLTPRAH